MIPHDSSNIQSDANGLCPQKIEFQPLRIIWGRKKTKPTSLRIRIFVQGDWNPNAIPRLVSAMCPRFSHAIPKASQEVELSKVHFCLIFKASCNESILDSKNGARLACVHLEGKAPWRSCRENHSRRTGEKWSQFWVRSPPASFVINVFRGIMIMMIPWAKTKPKKKQPPKSVRGT